MSAYQVTGTLSPDATTAHTGQSAGTHNGHSYWTWTNDAGTWYLFNPDTKGGYLWHIAPSMFIGLPPDGNYWKRANGIASPVGSYTSGTNYLGTATVSELPVKVHFSISGTIDVRFTQ